jgi:class 3 adenylate cyclase
MLRGFAVLPGRVHREEELRDWFDRKKASFPHSNVQRAPSISICEDGPVNEPQTRYATTVDGVHIAYQVSGEGPVDLVVVAWGLGLSEIWRGRRSGAFLRRLASFSRLILLDRRGTGQSDHAVDRQQLLSLEYRMEDVRAVMDACGSDRAVLLALEGGGFHVAAMFAATLPDRTVALIAYGAEPRRVWAPDYPLGLQPEELEAEIEETKTSWGTEELARDSVAALYATDRPDPRDVADFVATMHSLGGPGDMALGDRVVIETDVRHLLPSIRIPTAVIHRRADVISPIENGRYLAENIPGAVLIELPGAAHAWDADDALTSEVGKFLATIHQEEVELDRFLATVLFTDIVDSTAVATSLGDREWAELVRKHHHLVRGHLARYRGAEMDTAGDGFYATFDGPARAVRCALAITNEVRDLAIEVRAGIHTGEMQTIDGKLGGIAVTLGSRIAGMAEPSEVLVSQTVRDLVAGSGLAFEDRGEHGLKGVPDPWRLYRATSG